MDVGLRRGDRGIPVDRGGYICPSGSERRALSVCWRIPPAARLAFASSRYVPAFDYHVRYGNRYGCRVHEQPRLEPYSSPAKCGALKPHRTPTRRGGEGRSARRVACCSLTCRWRCGDSQSAALDHVTHPQASCWLPGHPRPLASTLAPTQHNFWWDAVVVAGQSWQSRHPATSASPAAQLLLHMRNTVQVREERVVQGPTISRPSTCASPFITPLHISSPPLPTPPTHPRRPRHHSLCQTLPAAWLIDIVQTYDNLVSVSIAGR